MALRRTGLLGALALGSAFAGADAQVEPLRATHIVVAPGDVSFYAPDSLYWMHPATNARPVASVAPEVRVARFDRIRGRWLAGDRHVGGSSAALPDNDHPRVPLAAGWDLVGDRPESGQQWFRSFALRERTTGKRYPIRPALPVREIWRAALERDSLSGSEYTLWWNDPPALDPYISHWAVSPQAFWFVCPSAGTGLSSIVRVGRRDHRLSTLSGGAVAAMAIDAVAQTRRSLWIAGHADRGSGLNAAGVFRLDLASNQWTRFLPDTTRWPAGRVTALAASGDSLWIATENGVAVYDEARQTSDARWFTVRMVLADSTDRWDRQYVVVNDAYSLVSHAPAREESRQRLRVALARRLAESWSSGGDDAPVSHDSIVGLIRGISAAHLDSALADTADTFDHALAWPALVARMTSGWLDRDSTVVTFDLDVLFAATALDDPRYLGLFSRIAERGSLDYRGTVRLARARAALGDPSARNWLRSETATEGDVNMMEPAALALRQTGDTLAGAMLARRFDEPGADSGDSPALLLAEVANVATPSQWHELIARLDASDRLRAALLDRVYTVSRRRLDSLVEHDSLTRALATESAHRELASYARSTAAARDADAWPAMDMLVELRDPAAPALLVPLLTKSPDDFRLANASLIQLTGVDSLLAALHPDTAQRAELQRFWQAWWAAHEASFRAAESSAGKAALRRWRTRALGIGGNGAGSRHANPFASS